ncbi:hypothetical protein C8R44DRAFT_753771 [Mycena epipterygia]|nr:hypothetical protein C8R44DRAFT_753771 [Mycena epipterygia]
MCPSRSTPTATRSPNAARRSRQPPIQTRTTRLSAPARRRLVMHVSVGSERGPEMPYMQMHSLHSSSSPAGSHAQSPSVNLNSHSTQSNSALPSPNSGNTRPRDLRLKSHTARLPGMGVSASAGEFVESASEVEEKEEKMDGTLWYKSPTYKIDPGRWNRS